MLTCSSNPTHTPTHHTDRPKTDKRSQARIMATPGEETAAAVPPPPPPPPVETAAAEAAVAVTEAPTEAPSEQAVPVAVEGPPGVDLSWLPPGKKVGCCCGCWWLALLYR